MKIGLFVLLVHAAFASDQSLWNHVLKMESVIVSVEHHGRQFHVWQESKGNFSRFYVTPLGELINSTIRCNSDKYDDEGRYIFRFAIRIWDPILALKVKQALRQMEIDSITSNILPLPMQMVRLSAEGIRTKRIYTHDGWLSNQNQPSEIFFELFTKNEELCQSLVNDAIHEPQEFLANLKLNLEFTIISAQQESRTLNITGNLIGESRFFAQLKNKVDKNGIVYLTSSDSNDLARNIYHTVLVHEEITASYIPSSEEDKIIHDLLGVISNQQIESTHLTDSEWESVFWDEIFTRPDITTEYLNEVFAHNESTNQFIFDSTKENDFYKKITNQYASKTSNNAGGGGGFKIGPFSFGAKAQRGGTNEESGDSSDEQKTHDKEIISKNDLIKSMEENKVNSRWNGQKFEQKPLELHRVNTKNLISQGQLFYRRVMLNKLEFTSKIELRPEPIVEETITEAEDLKNSEDMVNRKLKSLLSSIEDLTKSMEETTQKISTDLQNTKNDLQNIRNEILQHVQNVQNNLQDQMNGQVSHLRSEILQHVQNVQNNLQDQINGQVGHLNGRIDGVKNDLVNQIHRFNMLNECTKVVHSRGFCVQVP